MQLESLFFVLCTWNIGYNLLKSMNIGQVEIGKNLYGPTNLPLNLESDYGKFEFGVKYTKGTKIIVWPQHSNQGASL